VALNGGETYPANAQPSLYEGDGATTLDRACKKAGVVVHPI
jgi:hypothetical protein